MTERLLMDSDILIEYLRGRDAAIEYLENRDAELLISVMTVAELYSGAKGRKELTALSQFFEAFEAIPIDTEVARIGGDLRRRYGPSHSTGLADALIAATAQQTGAKLVTFNKKHFPMLKNIEVPYARGA